MNPLSQLAADLHRAQEVMPARADAAVKAEAQHIETQARGIDGTPETVVADFPGDGQAHLGGVGADGISTGSGAQSLSGIDMGSVADDLSDRLLTDGVNLITRGTP